MYYILVQSQLSVRVPTMCLTGYRPHFHSMKPHTRAQSKLHPSPSKLSLPDIEKESVHGQSITPPPQPIFSASLQEASARNTP